MDQKESEKRSAEVPQQIFEKFLLELSNTDVPVDIVERLRKVIDERNLTETAIKNAILPEE